jgi:hypothetical protein
MNTLFKVFAAACCIQALSLSAIAQGKRENAEDSTAIRSWLTKSFMFDRPDTGFVALPEGKGYSNKHLGATIKFITFPGRYHETKSEFAAQKAVNTSLLIDTVQSKLNGLEVFSIIREEVSPGKNKYENFISLVTIAGFGEVTVCILGAYPKSKDKILREKYIKVSLTIKEQ